ncbi:MAG: hypothetical protein GY820_00400 [Gammaproteobacteria bacterium]|nr:hypothetical protein [Gammaproteobacteria bacterium]
MNGMNNYLSNAMKPGTIKDKPPSANVTVLRTQTEVAVGIEPPTKTNFQPRNGQRTVPYPTQSRKCWSYPCSTWLNKEPPDAVKGKETEYSHGSENVKWTTYHKPKWKYPEYISFYVSRIQPVISHVERQSFLHGG